MPRSLFLIFDEMIDLFLLCKCKAFLSPIIVAFGEVYPARCGWKCWGKFQNENNVFKFINSRANGPQINSAIEEFEY